ncbi:unnamed protein product [Bemisia tabaci]|uniref:Signal peptide peptidase n=1 Tax=Bemisia tabaci TaxID=7038 RepID=A0A9P0AMD0_BEMTA|nr:unnamed protein product [Bemisia tabaci]
MDITNFIINQAKETLTEAEPAEDVNPNRKVPASPEGMAIAYVSLLIMAIFPIFFGSFRSVKHHESKKASGETPELMSKKDALVFPLIASAALLGLYIFFKIFSMDNLNVLITGYFFCLGVFALCHLLSPLISSLVPSGIPNTRFQLTFKEDDEDVIDYKFCAHDIVCLLCCSAFGSWYIFQKHWIANNLIGLAFAINGVELLHINNVMTSCILLCGLFLYDIFWVFGTNVMVTVARSFNAPIKLVFPQDLLERGISGSNFAMLGLGDIVLPGIFIALLLRFDKSLNRKSHFYFNATMLAYFVGLLVTVGVMHTFNHAQPALLYLVPACLGTPLFLALIRGDFSALIAYSDYPTEEKEASEKEVTTKSSETKSSKQTKNTDGSKSKTN